MSRSIIRIDEESCIGCGLCAQTCQHSVIEIIDGKARVTGENLCDGIGNCLPVCPVNAISFSGIATKTEVSKNSTAGCPGSNATQLRSGDSLVEDTRATAVSELRQWPVQIKLVAENASFFDSCNLLIAADCTAYAYSNIHADFMKNKITLIGCPKLDEGDYREKLSAIISKNNIKSVTVLRMEVPCCAGIAAAAKDAVEAGGKFIPCQVVTIATDGDVLSRQ